MKWLTTNNVMWKSFLSFWLKLPCPLCQRVAENTLCQYCQKKLLSYQFSNPKQSWSGNVPVFAWGKYDGELSRAIAKLKYNNCPELGLFLGNYLGQSWLNNCPISAQEKLIVLPIPLSQKKLQARGFNQAKLIAQGFCQITKNTLATEGLIRIKDTLAMFGLNAIQRENNIRGAFQVSPSWQQNPPKLSVLLLDDIYTRGTTVTEAAKILRQHKIKVIGAIAVAKTTLEQSNIIK